MNWHNLRTEPKEEECVMSKLEEEQILRKAEEIIARRNDERARQLAIKMNSKQVDLSKTSNYIAFYEGAKAITQKIRWLLNKKHPRTKDEWSTFINALSLACESNGSMNKLMYISEIFIS